MEDTKKIVRITVIRLTLLIIISCSIFPIFVFINQCHDDNNINGYNGNRRDCRISLWFYNPSIIINKKNYLKSLTIDGNNEQNLMKRGTVYSEVENIEIDKIKKISSNYIGLSSGGSFCSSSRIQPSTLTLSKKYSNNTIDLQHLYWIWDASYADNAGTIVNVLLIDNNDCNYNNTLLKASFPSVIKQKKISHSKKNDKSFNKINKDSRKLITSISQPIQQSFRLGSLSSESIKNSHRVTATATTYKLIEKKTHEFTWLKGSIQEKKFLESRVDCRFYDKNFKLLLTIPSYKILPGIIIRCPVPISIRGRKSINLKLQYPSNTDISTILPPTFSISTNIFSICPIISASSIITNTNVGLELNQNPPSNLRGSDQKSKKIEKLIELNKDDDDKYNISICVPLSSSQETGIQLIEWIEYHRYKGIDHFFIYDTRDRKYSKLDNRTINTLDDMDDNIASITVNEVLSDYSSIGLITVVPWKFTHCDTIRNDINRNDSYCIGEKELKRNNNNNNNNDITNNINIDMTLKTAMKSCYLRFRRSSKWIMMFNSMNEFIGVNGNNNHITNDNIPNMASFLNYIKRSSKQYSLVAIDLPSVIFVENPCHLYAPLIVKDNEDIDEGNEGKDLGDGGGELDRLKEGDEEQVLAPSKIGKYISQDKLLTILGLNNNQNNNHHKRIFIVRTDIIIAIDNNELVILSDSYSSSSSSIYQSITITDGDWSNEDNTVQFKQINTKIENNNYNINSYNNNNNNYKHETNIIAYISDTSVCSVMNMRYSYKKFINNDCNEMDKKILNNNSNNICKSIANEISTNSYIHSNLINDLSTRLTLVTEGIIPILEY